MTWSAFESLPGRLRARESGTGDYKSARALGNYGCNDNSSTAVGSQNNGCYTVSMVKYAEKGERRYNVVTQLTS